MLKVDHSLMQQGLCRDGASRLSGWILGLERAARALAESKLALVLCLTIGAAASVHLGEDANFDLKNYHLYIPYALLSGRLDIDWTAAGLQTFFNPALDVPYYVLAVRYLAASPRWVAAIQGLYFGLLLYLMLCINLRVFAERTALPALNAGVATVIGVTGAVTVAQIGTTFNDMPIAVLVMASLLILILAPADQSRDITAPAWTAFRPLAAGFLLGSAAGLKLTAALYAPAAVVAILVIATSWRAKLQRAFLVATGWIIGFVAFAGHWMWHLFTMTGNPVFPLYNHLFRSDWFPPINLTDDRFGPKSIGEAIFYPFLWARRNHSIVTEMPFRDARFASAFIALTVIAAIGAVALVARPATRARIGEALALSSPARAVIGFIIAAYISWIAVFSILRYAIPIEVLTGTIIVLAQVAAAIVPVGSKRPLLVFFFCCIIAIGLVRSTRYPSWGRVPFGERTFAVSMPEVPPGSLVIVNGHPLSYVIPFVQSENTSFVGVNWLTVAARRYRLFDETRRRISGHTGPVFVLTETRHRSYREVIGELGVTWNDNACEPVQSNLDHDLRLCAARRDRVHSAGQ